MHSQIKRVIFIKIMYLESLVMMPYARQSEEVSRTMRGSSGIIRIHCGLEGAGLLIRDLEQGLEKI